MLGEGIKEKKYTLTKLKENTVNILEVKNGQKILCEEMK